MNEFKDLAQSKTFWGAAVAIVGSALTARHYTLSAMDASQLVDLLCTLAGTFGGIVAIYGRVVATKKIGGA